MGVADVFTWYWMTFLFLKERETKVREYLDVCNGFKDQSGTSS